MKKLFSLFLFVALGFLASPVFAGDGDIWAVGPNDEVRVQDKGLLKMTSGFYSADSLIGIHETWMDLPASSQTRVLAWVGIATTSLLNQTSTYGLQGHFTQPSAPRGLTATMQRSSGSCVIVGSNTWGQAISESLTISSGVPSYTNQAFSFVSSVTVTATAVSILEANALFAVGISSHIGFANNISTGSDVLAVTENATRLSTGPANVNSGYDTIPLPSANGSNDYNIWYLLKKSVLAP